VTIVGFHASHEQLDPRSLLRAVQHAEQAGFDAAMCSDHFAPWSERQGHSGFAWSWLGAALATTSFSLGVVTAPGQRYHPAVAAQAMATLAQMFPGRFWAALGSGEAINEHITGDPWPPKEEREARLEETVGVLRRLLEGGLVTHEGRINVHRARIWSLPEWPPLLFGAAVGPETAAWAAGWADGLITVAQSPDALREVVQAYRGAGGRGPTALQVHLSWAATDDEALAIASDQWRQGLVEPPLTWDLDDPREFDRLTADASPGAVRKAVLVSADPSWHLDRLSELVDVGFDRVYLHHVGTAQEEFIDVFAERVLPQLKEVGA
jgi:probable non-F420 flavinoid oxidoreductase